MRKTGHKGLDFFSELRRRQVYRAGAAYLGPAVAAPDRWGRVKAAVVGAGFVAVVWVGAALWQSPGNGETGAVPVDMPVLAVLPFADRSPDGDQAYFADGLHDETWLERSFDEEGGVYALRHPDWILLRGNLRFEALWHRARLSGEPPAATAAGAAAPASSPTTSPPTTSSPPSGPLGNTSWRLVEFQSMSDAVGTIRPDDPSAFTMHLDAAGTVELKLGCNRATGRWSSEAAADGASGGLADGGIWAWEPDPPG